MGANVITEKNLEELDDIFADIKDVISFDRSDTFEKVYNKIILKKEV